MYTKLPNTEFLCALHSIPTPTTNLLDRATGGSDMDSGFLAAASVPAKFVSFVLYNAMFIGMLLLLRKFGRYLYRRKLNAFKDQSSSY